MSPKKRHKIFYFASQSKFLAMPVVGPSIAWIKIIRLIS